MRFVAATLAACLALAGCAGPSRVRSSTGPGSGFLTRQPAMLRVLRPEYSVRPILTAGDSLYANEPGAPPFILPGRATSLAARNRGDGTADLFVTHDDVWLDNHEGGAVSRLSMDLRNAGVLDADYALRTIDGYTGTGSAALIDSRVGFLRPYLFIGERVNPTRPPVVAAVDIGGRTAQQLTWLGTLRHSSLLALPVTSGRVVLAMTSGSGSGRDQLYLYVANSDTDVLSGNGQLFVFRADASVPADDRRAARIRKGVPIAGTFVPIEPGVARSPTSLEQRVQQLGCLNFVRLEGLAIDRERLNGFYFTDRFGYAASGVIQTSAGGGRLYHVTLDPTDPSRVEQLEVMLDATDGDDLYHPTSIDSDERCVMIQEDPGARGLHPARVLRYDISTRRVEPVAECVERDSRGRLQSSGVGGEWETTGILNVSDLLGKDSWLLAVQAHTLTSPQNSGRSWEAGQILMLRGPRAPRPEAPAGGSE